MYNMTNFTNSTNLYQAFIAVNDIANGTFFALFLFLLFIIFWGVLSNFEVKEILIADSFIITIIAMLGFIAGFIGWDILIIPIILLLGSIITHQFTKR